MTNAFSGKKLTSKLFLVYLEIKLQQINSRNKVFRRKQAPKKVPLLFLDVKMLGERFNQHFQML